MSIPLATAILKAVTEGAKVYHTWLKGKEKRHMQAAIDAGEDYIFINEDVTLTDRVREKKLRAKRKRFFKYN